MKKTMKEVSEILYKEDPMNTCCVENEVTDEYDDLAKLIVFEELSIKEAFDYSFWVDCLSEEKVNSLTALLT